MAISACPILPALEYWHNSEWLYSLFYNGYRRFPFGWNWSSWQKDHPTVSVPTKSHQVFLKMKLYNQSNWVVPLVTAVTKIEKSKQAGCLHNKPLLCLHFFLSLLAISWCWWGGRIGLDANAIFFFMVNQFIFCLSFGIVLWNRAQSYIDTQIRALIYCPAAEAWRSSCQYWLL